MANRVQSYPTSSLIWAINVVKRRYGPSEIGTRHAPGSLPGGSKSAKRLLFADQTPNCSCSMPAPIVPPGVIQVFDSPPAAAGTERIDVLLEQRGVVIERITSSGSQLPQVFTQPHDEWVLLARGTATLRMNDELLHLRDGDGLHIPAHVTHELLATSENAIWIAVHLK